MLFTTSRNSIVTFSKRPIGVFGVVCVLLIYFVAPQESSAQPKLVGPRAELFTAVADNDIEAVRKYLAQGMDANITGNYRNVKNAPLLWVALVRGAKSQLIILLLENGANPNASANYGETPLHIAAQKGRVDILGKLLDAKADLNARNSIGSTPFMYAAWNGKIPALEFLLDRGASLTDANSEGDSAMDFAIRRQKIDAFEYLANLVGMESISQSARLQLINTIVEEEVDDLLWRVLNSARDGEKRQEGFKAAFIIATRSNKPKAIYELLSRPLAQEKYPGELFNGFFAAADFGSYSVLEVMLNHGAEPDFAMPTTNWTALHFASARLSPETLDLLFKAGADPNIQSVRGWTPLHIAVFQKNREFTKALLDNGADPDVRGHLGRTPMYYAIMADDLPTFQLL